MVLTVILHVYRPEREVGSVMPPRPSGQVLLLPFGSCCIFAMLQTMSGRGKRRTVELSGRICAMTCVEDEYTRVISSNEFYKKQIAWCIETVGSFWEFIRVDRHGVRPTRVNMTVRFCMSWLSGQDCTTWTARQVFRWLQLTVGSDRPAHSLMYVAWSNRMDPCPIVGPVMTFTDSPDRAPSRLSLPPPKSCSRREPPSKRKAVAATVSSPIVSSSADHVVIDAEEINM